MKQVRRKRIECFTCGERFFFPAVRRNRKGQVQKECPFCGRVIRRWQ